jgi:hypothetical protein
MERCGVARLVCGMLLAVGHVDNRGHDVHDCGEQS